MKITVTFDRRADLSDENKRQVENTCLAALDADTAEWRGRILTYNTPEACSAVLERWELQGFSISEFESFEFSQESPRRAPERIMPARVDIKPQAERLVGRRCDSLTPTEERLSEHFGLYGDLYWCTYDPDTGIVETDAGHPGAPISIRVPEGTSPHDAVWELARVVDYVLNEMPAE